MAEYPDPRQLQPIRDAAVGCVVFLDFTDPLRARAIATELDRSCPKAVTVAIQSGHCSEDLIDLMHIGVREILSLPISLADLSRALVRASRRLSIVEDAESGGRIFAFLPAKPGSGATTLAVHTVASAAALANERTLLIDFDLRLALFGFSVDGDVFLEVALEPAAIVESFADGDAIKPGLEGAALAKIANSFEGFQENFLSGIGGVCRVSEHSQDEVVNRSVIVSDEPVECGFRARLQLGNEFAFVATPGKGTSPIGHGLPFWPTSSAA